MITYDQFKDIAESLGYKVKKVDLVRNNSFYIDVTSSPYAQMGFLVAEYVPNRKEVDHWMSNSYDLHIGPNYDDSNNYDYIKQINTSRNNAEVIRDPEILKDMLTTFTKNWKYLIKDIRKQKIMEL